MRFSSLVTSLMLNTSPRELAPTHPEIIVEAKCPGCGETLRYKTDPRKDPILMGHNEGACPKCQTAMTGVPLKLWTPQ